MSGAVLILILAAVVCCAAVVHGAASPYTILINVNSSEALPHFKGFFAYYWVATPQPTGVTPLLWQSAPLSTGSAVAPIQSPNQYYISWSYYDSEGHKYVSTKVPTAGSSRWSFQPQNPFDFQSLWTIVPDLSAPPSPDALVIRQNIPTGFTLPISTTFYLWWGTGPIFSERLLPNAVTQFFVSSPPKFFVGAGSCDLVNGTPIVPNPCTVTSSFIETVIGLKNKTISDPEPYGQIYDTFFSSSGMKTISRYGNVNVPAW